MGDAVLFEHDVVDVAGRQVVAHGQAGLAAADDGDSDVLGHDLSFLERFENDLGLGWIGLGGGFDAGKLAEGQRAGRAVQGLDPVAGGGQGGSAAARNSGIL